MVMIYHDGPGNTSTPGRHRTLHAECLMYGSGAIANAIRTGGTTNSQSGAIANCLNNPFMTETVGFKSSTTNMYVSSNGTSTGSYERFEVGTQASGGYVSPASYIGFNGAQTNLSLFEHASLLYATNDNNYIDAALNLNEPSYNNYLQMSYNSTTGNESVVFHMGNSGPYFVSGNGALFDNGSQSTSFDVMRYVVN